MIRDITFGQYYPVESPIHRLDPRVKILCTFLFLISLFVQNNLAGYGIAAIFLAFVIHRSKVPLSYIVKGMKPVAMLLLFTIVMNLFLTKGEGELVRFWVFRITENGLRTSFYMALRLTFLVTGSSIMTFTTTPTSLTDGLERVLGPLKRIGVPVHDVAMMMAIALRFIPILLEETDKIMKAQMARGADFESGNVLQRGKAMIPILVPLIISSFRRANDLAMAMEARCYHGGDGRTKMKPLHYCGQDYVAFMAVCVYFVVMVIVGRTAPLRLWIF